VRCSKPAAQQEVAIAAQYEARLARSRVAPQRFAHAGAGRFRIVVADPDLEQVTKDVQASRDPRLAVQEPDELRDALRRAGVEVQIGHKQVSVGTHRWHIL
jgi:hypothetical protein